MAFLIIALLIALLAVGFALQNIDPVTITIFTWELDTPLGVALVIALIAGVLITLFLSIPGRIKSGRASSAHKKQIAALEVELNSLKLKLDQAEAAQSTLENKLVSSEAEIHMLEEQLASVSANLEQLQPLPEQVPPAPTSPTDALPPSE